MLAAFLRDEQKQGVLTPKDTCWWCEAGNHHEDVTGRPSAEAWNELCPVLCSVLAGSAASRRKGVGGNCMQHYFRV